MAQIAATREGLTAQMPNEALHRMVDGETDGGGTMLSKEKEIEFIDVHMFLSAPEASIPFVIQLLEERGAPKGSKLTIYEKDNVSKKIRFGVCLSGIVGCRPTRLTL